MRTVRLCSKSTSSRPSMNVVTKCRRVCSPSVTTSMPACSWSRTARRTASRLPSSSAAPSSFHAAHSDCGSASQEGFGRLPAIVVRNSVVIGVLARRNAESNGIDYALDARPHARVPFGVAASIRFMPRILFADYDFPDVDLERAIFADAGLELKLAQCQTDAQVIDAARDCVAILLQYAPITA